MWVVRVCGSMDADVQLPLRFMIVQMKRGRGFFVAFKFSLQVCKKSARFSMSPDSISSTFGQHLWE